MAEHENGGAELYLDRDGDGNLMEEEPLPESEPSPGWVRSFDVRGVAGRFVFPGARLQPELNVRLDFSGEAVGLHVRTVYMGSTPAFGKAVRIVWMPGVPPDFRMVMMKATRSTELRLGAGRAGLVDGIAFEDGKPVVSLRKRAEKDLLAFGVPRNTVAVKICRRWESRKPDEVGCPYCGRGRGVFFLCVPEAGRVSLDKGRHFYVKPVLTRVVDGMRWKLALSRFHWESETGPSLDGPVEPLAISLETARERDRLTFLPAVKDASGNLAEIYRNGDRIVPRLSIRAENGEEVEILDFRYR
jgi:hypothetical protein